MDQAGVRMDLIMLTKKQYLMKIILKVGKAAWCKEIEFYECTEINSAISVTR